ncbi:MAG: amidase [Acidobacteriota bacterium]
MNRRDLIKSAFFAAVSTSAAEPPVDLEELTTDDIQAGFQAGQFTAQSLTEAYLARIDAIDRGGPAINAVIELNPDALKMAAELDRERQAKGSRGPLHGVPVLVKDNIDTANMNTTAGSLALLGAPAPKTAFLVTRLRAAGAVLLGKTNLSEWANFRGEHSTSGWSGRGGQTKNPYALNRNPSGSSSGSGAAASASLCAVAVGTETDGSIVSPSSINGLVGIKPTVGLVSRSGIIPISASQDTAGSMARTVRDAVLLLNALAGTDATDSATTRAPKTLPDYSEFLDRNGLRGARIGIVRKSFGFNAAVDKLMEQSMAAMKSSGAEMIDPVEIPSDSKISEPENLVLLYEFKAGLNAYLKARGRAETLASLIAFNENNGDRELYHFGQELFLQAEKKGLLTDPAYRKARAECIRLTRTEGIDAACSKYRLQALVAPTSCLAWLTDYVNGDSGNGGCSTPPAVAGYPHITVPAGLVNGLPAGISFFGPAWSEPALIKVAYAFEQTTKARRRPAFAASV